MQLKMPSIFAVTAHTAHVGPGTIFVAIKGMKEDGLSYVADAIAKGATHLIIADDAIIPPELDAIIKRNNVSIERVANTRKALAEKSAQALNYPAKKLRIIGITGTKGKTTTAWLLFHILKTAAHSVALLSTVKNYINEHEFATQLTTQQPDYLHHFFDLCVKAKVEYVVMEVAAQALSLHRTDTIIFAGIIMTNFSAEHAEFYADLQQYFNAKKLILKQAVSDTKVLINADDAWCKQLLQENNSYNSFGTLDEQATYRFSLLSGKQQAIQWSLACNGYSYIFDCPALLGEFNSYNGTVAAAMALEFGVNIKTIQDALLNFKAVPGRLEQHFAPRGVRFIIDYAHNPSSYQALLPVLRSLTDDLIVIFGAGGERDRTKRPIMGALAAQYADTVILTTDNPRSEDPVTIIDDIKGGIIASHTHKIIVELDREEAIKKAYQMAGSTTLIAVLGKGPDEYQLVKGIKTYFSEKNIIKSLH